MARKKAVKLKVVAITEVFALGNHWWARVNALGPEGMSTMKLGFESEEDARGCLGLVFKKVSSSG